MKPYQPAYIERKQKAKQVHSIGQRAKAKRYKERYSAVSIAPTRQLSEKALSRFRKRIPETVPDHLIGWFWNKIKNSSDYFAVSAI